MCAVIQEVPGTTSGVRRRTHVQKEARVVQLWHKSSAHVQCSRGHCCISFNGTMAPWRCSFDAAAMTSCTCAAEKSGQQAVLPGTLHLFSTRSELRETFDKRVAQFDAQCLVALADDVRRVFVDLDQRILARLFKTNAVSSFGQT